MGTGFEYFTSCIALLRQPSSVAGGATGDDWVLLAGSGCNTGGEMPCLLSLISMGLLQGTLITGAVGRAFGAAGQQDVELMNGECCSLRGTRNGT